MRSLIVVLSSYFAVLGIGYFVETSKIPIFYKFSLSIALALLVVALILKLRKGMSKFENAVFTVVLVSTLAISWVSRDIGEGKLSIFTVAILFVLLGAIATTVKKFAEHRSDWLR